MQHALASRDGRVTLSTRREGEHMRWDDAPIKKRVALSRKAGLEGTVGSKAWDSLSKTERQAILRVGKKRRPKRTRKLIPDLVIDYLMWVGAFYYPTYRDFITEAKRMGCCKKLPHELASFIPGLSRIFLAHDDGITGEGFVFGYFVADRLEVIVPPGGGLPTWVSEQCSPTVLVDKETERRCGFRQEGGLYLMSSVERDRLMEISRAVHTKLSKMPGGFIAIIPPVEYTGPRFRGALKVDGELFLTPWEDGGLSRFMPPSDLYTAGRKIPWTEETEELLLETVAAALDVGESKSKAFTKLSWMLSRPKCQVLSRYKTILHRPEENEDDD